MKKNFFAGARTTVQTFAVAASGLMLAASSHATATAIDVTDVVASIAAQAAPISLVGGAVLVIYGGVKAFKWVRAAMS